MLDIWKKSLVSKIGIAFVLIYLLFYTQGYFFTAIEGSVNFDVIRKNEFKPDFIDNETSYWFQNKGAVLENYTAFSNFWDLIHNNTIDSLGFPMLENGFSNYNILFLIISDVDCKNHRIQGVSNPDNTLRVHILRISSCSSSNSILEFTYYYYFGWIDKIGDQIEKIEYREYETYGRPGSILLSLSYIILPVYIIIVVSRYLKKKD